MILLAVLMGCRGGGTRFEVHNYNRSGDAEQFAQTFDECYYCRDASGNVNIVARQTSAAGQGPPVTQIVHLKTFWVPQPGRTYAERTMINATVGYLIVSGPDGATFEGSGFLSVRENVKRTRMTGKLELSSLSPQRRLGNGERLFDLAQLMGEFNAKRNKAEVVAALNDMRRMFGRLPRVDRSNAATEVR